MPFCQGAYPKIHILAWQVAALTQVGKKPLNEIAGSFTVKPLTTGKGIARIPVTPAQLLQGISTMSITRIACAKDTTPLCRRESCR
jgi:hypothetical protein